MQIDMTDHPLCRLHQQLLGPSQRQRRLVHGKPPPMQGPGGVSRSPRCVTFPGGQWSTPSLNVHPNSCI